MIGSLIYRSRFACSFLFREPRQAARLDGVGLSSFLTFFSVVAVAGLDRCVGDKLGNPKNSQVRFWGKTNRKLLKLCNLKGFSIF